MVQISVMVTLILDKIVQLTLGIWISAADQFAKHRKKLFVHEAAALKQYLADRQNLFCLKAVLLSGDHPVAAGCAVVDHLPYCCPVRLLIFQKALDIV